MTEVQSTKGWVFRKVPSIGVHEPSTLHQAYTHPWGQILLISVICFCCPGMYNALTGIGGSGQVDPTVAANATVALQAATAGSSLFIAGPIFNRLGPRTCLLISGWTYPLYSGSLLCFNKTGNGAFVIGSGAILGVGVSFLWVGQGSIMATYVPESQKGRAIAAFWVIFNLGGGVGSLASFGLNFHSSRGTVSDTTYIALMILMAMGWVLGLLICTPSAKVICMIPLFFSANVFYSYQQNNVNGMNFNIRTRSLNGSLYWIAQMMGGLIIGLIMDTPQLSRPARARVAWTFLFVTGMCIWGGGYAFERWSTDRIARGFKQDIDFTQREIFLGPMFLYMFYGAFDAFWQGFCYWLIGAQSNSPAVVAILVGVYKTFQSTGGAMAWRVNALETPAMTQFFMDWSLCMAALVIAIPSVLSVKLTSTT